MWSDLIFIAHLRSLVVAHELRFSWSLPSCFSIPQSIWALSWPRRWIVKYPPPSLRSLPTYMYVVGRFSVYVRILKRLGYPDISWWCYPRLASVDHLETLSICHGPSNHHICVDSGWVTVFAVEILIRQLHLGFGVASIVHTIKENLVLSFTLPTTILTIINTVLCTCLITGKIWYAEILFLTQD